MNPSILASDSDDQEIQLLIFWEVFRPTQLWSLLDASSAVITASDLGRFVFRWPYWLLTYSTQTYISVLPHPCPSGVLAPPQVTRVRQLQSINMPLVKLGVFYSVLTAQQVESFCNDLYGTQGSPQALAALWHHLFHKGIRNYEESSAATIHGFKRNQIWGMGIAVMSAGVVWDRRQTPTSYSLQPWGSALPGWSTLADEGIRNTRAKSTRKCLPFDPREMR